VIAARKRRRDSTTRDTGETAWKAPGRDLFGHPRGLSVLFAAETWEQLSYFGNSALVVLYMVQHLLQRGRIEGVIGFAAIKAG
jgi:proton-dependent oligopeptide transporter, POT family